MPNGVIERHGRGVHTSADGAMFDGQWINDKMTDNCRITFNGGATYEGAVQDNYFQGEGRYTWPNGAYFEGYFEKNKSVVHCCSLLS